MFTTILTLLGAIGLFLYGLNLMSGALMKLGSEKMRHFIPWMAKSPINGILSGAGITIMNQSSSAATVMLVSSVNAGAITLAQAILAIMGANIGTSVTAWLIALFGFKLNLPAFCYPFIAIGFVCMMMKGRKRKTIGEIILGFGLIFLGMQFMINEFAQIGAITAPLSQSSLTFGKSFLGILFFCAVGCVSAFLFQSSGSLLVTMLLISAGWIGFPMAAAMVMGINIGTTITANLAASDANIQAKRAALAHTLFNVMGTILFLVLFGPLVNLTSIIIDGNCSGVIGVALFHTLFNLLTTCVLAWFINPFEKLVTYFVKASDAPSEDDTRLKFISARTFSSPSIAIAQAEKEVANFGHIVADGFSNVALALAETDEDKFEEYRMKLVRFEELTDKIEYQTAAFLNKLTASQVNEEEAERIKVLYRIIGELESIGDCCENLSRIFERERVHNRKFDETAVKNINIMIDTVSRALGVMTENLDMAAYGKVTDISNAYSAEDEINQTRNTLRAQGISQIEAQTGNYQSLNYFLDIIAELEAMGDFMINVSQAVVKKDLC